MGGGDTFADCARRLSAACSLDGASPESRDFERVRVDLIRSLLARFHFLGPDEIAEFADEAMERLVRESRRQGRELANPAGWLVTVAGNLAKDRLKRQDPEPLPHEDCVADTKAEKLLGHLEAKDSFDSAIATAIREGDDVAVRVVQVWLEMAEETGEAPSSRAVGTRCGYSHTTVQQALARFVRYLP
jgi:DNA-directed RNA polymerase specialized sigma24 family protein